MKINIAERLRPFSHEAGVFVPLPGSLLQLQVFPTLLRVFDSEKLIEEKPLVGSYKGFTVMLDLERGCIKVWSRGQEGIFRYHIYSHEGSFVVGEGKDNCSIGKMPRLSLGSHKKQDWTLVKRRLDMCEILPVWHRLGKMVPEVSEHNSGSAALIAECEEAIAEKKHDRIVEILERLFLAGFHGIMAPRLVDEDHQGILEPWISMKRRHHFFCFPKVLS